MKVSFFPGCSLEGTAREYGESIEAVCSSLDIQLQELDDWSCCGASSAHCTNEYLSIALPARNLALAEKLKQDLVTPCAACFSRLKTAEKTLAASKRMSQGLAGRGQSRSRGRRDVRELTTAGPAPPLMERGLLPLLTMRIPDREPMSSHQVDIVEIPRRGDGEI